MAKKRAPRSIPVVIVAGFLGSGKTTLLNHLLHNNGGTRIGVIVNDFGSVNVDAMMVAGQVDSMMALSNGCLCCAVDVSDMDEMLNRLAHRRSEIDVIVVEASGLAEPRNMIRLVLGSENPYITYGGLVMLVDGAEYQSSRQRHPELDQHVAIADLVVLNKTDRIDADAHDALLADVCRINPAPRCCPPCRAESTRICCSIGHRARPPAPVSSCRSTTCSSVSTSRRSSAVSAAGITIRTSTRCTTASRSRPICRCTRVG